MMNKRFIKLDKRTIQSTLPRHLVSLAQLVGICFLVLPYQIKAMNFELKPNQFYLDRERGFIWFEDLKKLQAEKDNKKDKKDKTNKDDDEIKEFDILKNQNITDPNIAKEQIEALKMDIEDKKSLMLVNRSPESIKKYWEAEDRLWKITNELDDAWRTALMLYPKSQDLYNNPTNVHAVKFKRARDAEERGDKIKAFAKEYQLVFFMSFDCSYCKEFGPILMNFADYYGFDLEIIGDKDGEFLSKKVRYRPDLTNKLKVDRVPTVMAVQRGGHQAFTLFQGYASFSELEEYSEYIINYMAKGAMNNINSNNNR